MPWPITTLITGLSAFVATNLDDILILMVFFSQVNATLRPHHIVVGQYLGFAVLLGLSLPGFLGGFLIPHPWLGLLGLLPLALGIRSLLSNDTDPADDLQTVSPQAIAHRPALIPPQTYQVAAVTVANGGDNIGVYLPLFSTSTWASLGILLALFVSLLGIWCWVAYALANHPAIASGLTRYGHRLLPFVLIGLGIFILIEGEAYQLVKIPI